MARICVSLTEAGPEQLAAAGRADLVELRLDHLGPDGWVDLAARLGKPVVITYRQAAQGGGPHARALAEDQRLAVLSHAARPHQKEAPLVLLVEKHEPFKISIALTEGVYKVDAEGKMIEPAASKTHSSSIHQASVARPSASHGSDNMPNHSPGRVAN